MCKKVKEVLLTMEAQDMKVADFLDALSWGNASCIVDPKVRREKTALLHDQRLPSILRRWALPPRSLNSKNRRAEGAGPLIKAFTMDWISNMISEELENIAPHLLSSTVDDVRSTTLVATGFNELSQIMKENAPTLWALLESACIRPRKRSKSKKSNQKVSIVYARSEYLIT
jgi:hypothetical protein